MHKPICVQSVPCVHRAQGQGSRGRLCGVVDTPGRFFPLTPNRVPKPRGSLEDTVQSHQAPIAAETPHSRAVEGQLRPPSMT